MPIRFRCPKCQGLLSIARRKAGMTTTCPNCRADVTVPVADEPAASAAVAEEEPTKRSLTAGAAMVKVRVANGKTAPKPTDDPPSEPLFERPDFEKLIDRKAKTGETKPTASAVMAPSPAAPPAHPMIGAEGGFYVSRGAVAVFAVMMVVLVVMAFATGFLLGS